MTYKTYFRRRMMQIQRGNLAKKNQDPSDDPPHIQREIRFGWNHLPTSILKHPGSSRKPAVEGWK